MNIPLNRYAFGTIFFKEKHIAIDDKSSRTPGILFQLQPFIMLALAGYNLYLGVSGHRLLYIIFGIIFLVLSLFFYRFNFKRTNKREIFLSEIDSAKLKNILGFMYVDFVLQDGKTRRVYNIRKREDWLKIKHYLDKKKVNSL